MAVKFNIQIIHPRHSRHIPIRIPRLGLRFSQEDLRINCALPCIASIILACHCKELGHGWDTAGLFHQPHSS